MIRARDGRLEIRCDGHGCGATYCGPAPARVLGRELLRRAYGAGWRTETCGDLCPACAAIPKTAEQPENLEHARARARWLASLARGRP